MHDSKLNTMAVPVVGSDSPATVTQATDVPFRVMVRNVGGNIVFLAHSSGALQAAPVSADTYQLPPGQVDVFVLNEKQGLYAASQGGGGVLSCAISVALPTTK
jgi:hypothetical protein